MKKNKAKLLSDFNRAKEIAPYSDDELVRTITKALIENGGEMLHTHYLAESEQEHVAKLLEYFDVPLNTAILDVGCGTGKVAELMVQQRPDLQFVLLNISQAQLEMAPNYMFKLKSDMHTIPLIDNYCNAIMINYSLGHGLLYDVMKEATRVLTPGGILFIYDITTTSNNQSKLIEKLGYRPHTITEVCNAAIKVGLKKTMHIVPNNTNTTNFERLFGSITEHGIDLTRPVIYRFIK